MLPKDSTLIVQLCEVVLEQFPHLKANCAQMELTLLVFPLIPPEQVTEQCRTVQDALGCLHVDAAIQQVLTWGYWGRKTGLIVDVGYSASFVTPIYRGFLLEEQVLPLVTGSFFVSAQIRKLLLHQAETVDSDQADIYAQLANNAKAISKIKQTFCQVRPYEVDGHFDKIVQFRYQDTELSLGSLPWQATEVLFQPTLLRVGDKGLTDALIDVLERVDTSIRAELASNIVLTGGGSMFPGLRSRIQNDLEMHLPHLAVKVFDLEYPLYSTWLGAAKM
jgi:actin-related protein